MAERRRLKVLFLTTWYPTKEQPVVGVFVREHAKAVRLYDEVVVLHCAGIDPNLKAFWRIEQETDATLTEGIRTYRVWYRRLPIPKVSFFIHLWSVWRAFRYIAAHGFFPDVIHAHVYDAAISATLISKIKRVPLVITEHNSAFPRRLLSPKQAFLARLTFQSAKRVLPVSYALQKGIKDYDISARFAVIPNVVDTQLFRPAIDRQRSSTKRLLFVGLLNSVKGLTYLLQALARLRLERDDWRLEIVGDGPEREEYEKLAEQLGLVDKITFHGLKPKFAVAELMRRSDIFVLPSLWENLPCVLLEATASGLPMISTLTGGIPEVVKEETGMLVPPGDVIGLSTAIANMLESLHKFDRDTIAQQARRYSPESVGSLIHSIYEDCLQER